MNTTTNTGVTYNSKRDTYVHSLESRDAENVYKLMTLHDNPSAWFNEPERAFERVFAAHNSQISTREYADISEALPAGWHTLTPDAFLALHWAGCEFTDDDPAPVYTADETGGVLL